MGEIIAFPKKPELVKAVTAVPDGEISAPVGAAVEGVESKQAGPVTFKVSVDAKSMTMPVPVAQWIAMSQALAFYASQGFDHGAMARQALGLVVAGHGVKEESN